MKLSKCDRIPQKINRVSPIVGYEDADKYFVAFSKGSRSMRAVPRILTNENATGWQTFYFYNHVGWKKQYP